jgi:hypothetical protein
MQGILPCADSIVKQAGRRLDAAPIREEMPEFQA